MAIYIYALLVNATSLILIIINLLCDDEIDLSYLINTDFHTNLCC